MPKSKHTVFRRQPTFEGKNLRSRPIGSSFSGVLALISNVSTGGTGAGAATGAPPVLLLIRLARGVLHVLILVVGSAIIGVVADAGELARDVDFLTLEEAVDDVADLAIAWAEPGGIAVAGLRLRLQPEEVAVRGGGKLEGKYAAVGLGGGLGCRLVFVGREAAVGRDHHKVKLGVGEGHISLSPAEVYQLCWLSARVPLQTMWDAVNRPSSE